MAVVPEKDGGSGAAELVRNSRQAAGLTQQELADRAGVSVAAVRDLEQGRTRRPRRALADRLAAALGLDPDQLRDPGAGTRRSGGAPPGSGGRPGTGLWLGILGPVEARRDGVPLALGEPRQRMVLGLLALDAGTAVHRDTLVDALWGQDPPAAAVNLVQAYVGRLRRVLDPDRSPRDTRGVLVSTGTGYRLQLGVDQLDWLSFRRLTMAGSRGEPEAYQEALLLWRGMPLADVDALRRHPAVTAAVREWAAAVAGYAQAALRAGTPEPVLPHLWRWADADPLNERAHALLMLALAASGQQAAALTVFAEVRDRLDHQLGVRPGAELAEAHVRVLRQEISGGAYPVQPPAPRVVPQQLPASARHFVGREDELTVLESALRGAGGSDGGPVISAITGTAGVGKSTLALHWSHKVAHHFPDGQLYVNLRGYDPVGPPLNPADAVRGFLEALRVPVDGIPQDVQAQAALYRSLLAGRRVLVVLDNARDSEQARPLLPGTGGSMVLVTSRSDLTGLVAHEGAQPIGLALFGAAESRRLLAGYLGAERVARQARAADELVALCARLPLALSIIGARGAGRPDFSLDTLVTQVRDALSRLDALSTDGAPSDLRAVLSCSYQHLSPAAARLFRLLGLHPGPDVSGPAAASLAGVPPARVGALLDELIRAHLLSEHVSGRYTFHDLLRAYAAEQAHARDSDGERQAAIRRLLDHYLHTAHAAALLQEPPRDPLALAPPFDGVTPEPLADDAQAAAWFAAEHRILVACVPLAAEAGLAAHAWQIAWTLMTSFSRLGHWDDLATSQSIALEAARRADDLAGQAYAHRFLGRVRALLGRHEEAYGHLRQALELFRRLDDPAAQAAVHVGLVREFERQHRPGEALEHAKQALELQRSAGYRIGEAIGLNNVGWCYVQLGEYREALSWSEQALALHQQIGYRPGEAYTWDTLGYAYHHLGRYAEATSCYTQALALYRRLEDRYEQAETLSRLGDTQAAAGDRGAARESWHRALAILDELHHPDADALRGKLRGPATPLGRPSPSPDRTTGTTPAP